MTDHQRHTITAILADALCLAAASLGPGNDVYRLAMQAREKLGGHGYREALSVYDKAYSLAVQGTCKKLPEQVYLFYIERHSY